MEGIEEETSFFQRSSTFNTRYTTNEIDEDADWISDTTNNSLLTDKTYVRSWKNFKASGGCSWASKPCKISM